MRNRTNTPTVVASVEEQTAAAAALAGIAGQDRLADPRLNPAVRGHADALRDEQHRKSLEAEHSRKLRAHRVSDRRAGDAEKALELIRSARAATSPARSVIALHNGRRKFMGIAMTASLALSAGSAMGVATLAKSWGAPSEVGYIAEIGLTGLSNAAILYRSHLAEHRAELEGWQSRTLWAMAIIPLLASAVANAVSVGAVGVFCSLGAAAFGLLAAVIADRSAATLQARAAEVTTDEENELRTIAMGESLPTVIPVDAPAAGRTDSAHDTDQVRTDTVRTDARADVRAESGKSARADAPKPSARRTAVKATGDKAAEDAPLIDRAALVTELADQIRDAVHAGEQWRPDYTGLMDRTHFKRRWCEEVVRDAKLAVISSDDDEEAAQAVDVRTPPSTDGAADSAGADPRADDDADESGLARVSFIGDRRVK